MAKKRKQFNSSGPFTVRGKMLMSGLQYEHGEPFPQEGVTDRRLRQLWDLRRIEMAPRSIFEELMEGVKDMADAREQAAPKLDTQTIINIDIAVKDVDQFIAGQIHQPSDIKTVSLSDLSDEEIFAKAKVKTGVNYRARARALKVLESE